MEDPLSLRPTAAAEDTLNSLASLVDQIWQERGHMRNVDEDILKAEIEAAANRNDDASSDTSDDAEPADVETRTKELYKEKAEMLELVSQASNEALTLLDFVSLLVSRDAPRQGEQTMSPALKQMVPAGTFAFDRNPAAARMSEAEEARAQEEATGLNFQSLHATADSLLGFATNLEQEMARETKYWEEILSVSEKGWTLSRVRGEGRSVGVRYGCVEASVPFRARGLAALRPGSDGNLILDKGLSNEPKCLRVRIVEDGEIVGSSSAPELLEHEGTPLESLVHQSRDSVFDEELYHELTREARNLLSYAVRVNIDHICIPRERDSTSRPRQDILIDLVDLADASPADGEWSETIALYLRLGLSHAYKDRYRRRTQPPPPLSSKAARPETLSLIESMLCLLQHQARVHQIQPRLKYLERTLKAASLQCSLDVDNALIRARVATRSASSGKTRTSNHHKTSSTSPSTSTLDAIFAASMGPQVTSLNLSLPDSSNLSLRIATSLYAPYYGTVYDLTPPSSPNILEHAATKDPTELFNSIDGYARDAILRFLASECAGWTLQEKRHSIRAKMENTAKEITVQLKNGKMASVSRTKGGETHLLAVWDGEALNKGSQSRLLDIISMEGGDEEL